MNILNNIPRKIDDCVVGALPRAAHSVRVLLKTSFHRTRQIVQRFFEANNTIIENRFAEKSKKYFLSSIFSSKLLILKDLLFFRFSPSVEGIFVGFDATHECEGLFAVLPQVYLQGSNSIENRIVAQQHCSKDNHFS